MPLTIDYGNEIINILQNAFIDARLFGSSYAFKKGSSP